MHRDYIDKIIKSQDDDKMEELKDMLEDTIDYLKIHDEKKYHALECELYEIVNGKVLSEEKAVEWVESMKPKAKWTMTETKAVGKKYGVVIPEVAFYTIMNMIYSDYSDVLGEGDTEESINNYIKMTEDWYFDEDTSKMEDEKLYCYYKNIVK